MRPRARPQRAAARPILRCRGHRRQPDAPADAHADDHPAAPPTRERAQPDRAIRPDAPVSETQIDASEGRPSPSKERIAVFGQRPGDDPRFQLACDKLTVFLNKSAPPTNAPAAAATPRPHRSPHPATRRRHHPPTKTSAAAEASIIAWRRAMSSSCKSAPRPNPARRKKSPSAGARKATFDNKTGDMTLHGMPESRTERQ